MNKLFCNKGLSRFVLLIVFVFGSSILVNSATFTVTKTADTNDGVCNADCSLREAIDAANGAPTDDVIEFSSAVFGTSQTITLSGTQLQVENNGSLIINGTGANLLAINGNNSSRVFYFQGVTATVNKVKVTGGKILGNGDGGGIFNNFGSITINNTIISNNLAATGDFSGGGGGIYNRGAMIINDTIISSNFAVSDGAGIKNDSGSSNPAPILTIKNSTITGNTTNGLGGGICNYYDSNINITNSTITNNTANFGGGFLNDGSAIITGGNITNNTVIQSGGGIRNGSRAKIEISGLTISGNAAGLNGGGISSNGDFGDRVTINNSIISNNRADSDGNSTGNGGGINSDRSIVSVTNSEITGNSAFNGGGIYTDSVGQTLTVINSSVKNNWAGKSGGGVFNEGTFVLSHSTISGNSALASLGEGGGIYNSSFDIINVNNSTITDNKTATLGGGIFNRGTVNLSNSTIANNQANTGGGGIFNFNSHIVNARNTIIADNINNNASSPDFGGALTSQGYNLIENTTGTTITGVLIGNIIGQDPQLLPLGNYGGITQTVGLQPISPAIDRADPNNFPETDQRGIPRPQDGDLNGSFLPDIGAYERQVFIFTVTKTADTNDNVCDADCSLREAITATNTATTLDNAIFFAPSIFSAPQTITLTNGELNITNNGTLVIFGPGAALLTISGNNLNRVFFINTGAAAINALTISGGNDPVSGGYCGGGGLLIHGILNLTNSIISNNRSSLGGGGICTRHGSKVNIINSIFTNNSASSTGGGIYNNAGIINIANSTVSNNTSNIDGGGIVNAGGLITINNVQIIGNSAARSLGGFRNDGTAFVTGSIINNNKANTGGAGGIGNSGNLIIANTTVSNNTAAREGAGIANGGILNANNLVITSNHSNLYGGGVYTAGFSNVITIINSTISGNTASGSGSMNDGNGGGIYNDSTLNLTNSTVSNNLASSTSSGESGFGGGIFNMRLLNLVNVTVANNSSLKGGGGIRNGSMFSSSSIVNARNTIIADNNSTPSAPDFDGVLNSQGYNLIENINGVTINGTTTGNITGQDPKLGPLANNGGPTQTLALLLGSPAIDAADLNNFPLTDQRGLNRPKDGDRNGSALPDIGAFERDNTTDNSAPFDFDGDGKTDLSIFRPTVSEWWYLRSLDGGNRTFQFGNSSDRLVPADYTGDGKTDIAFFRPSTNQWFVLRSEDNSFYSFPFGAAGDVPAPADYDGDGRADAAVFRSSNTTWYINKSSGGTTIQQFGAAGDVPVVADYDGDNKADIAIYRPSLGQWWLLRSSAGTIAFQFGAGTDKPVQGDYTGDGKADVAFFRPSTGEWFILRSENNSFYAFPFGAGGDVPSPGDYDGDGKFDAAVFRPSNATWYVQRSTSGTMIQTFGQTSDLPVPNAFVP